MKYSPKHFRRASFAALALVVPVGTGLGLAAAINPSSATESSSLPNRLEASQKSATRTDNSVSPPQLITNTQPGQPINTPVNNSILPLVSHTSIKSTVSGNQAEVIVNGEKISLPANGTVNKTTTSPDGQTNVKVSLSSNNQGQASSSSSSSINLNVSSQSTSSD